MCLFSFDVFVFDIVEVQLFALKKYLLSASLIMLTNFVTTLVIQNIKKSKKNDGSARQLANKRGVHEVELKNLSWSAPSHFWTGLSGTGRPTLSAIAITYKFYDFNLTAKIILIKTHKF
jgi:hypothetical protein